MKIAIEEAVSGLIKSHQTISHSDGFCSARWVAVKMKSCQQAGHFQRSHICSLLCHGSRKLQNPRSSKKCMIHIDLEICCGIWTNPIRITLPEGKHLNHYRSRTSLRDTSVHSAIRSQVQPTTEDRWGRPGIHWVGLGSNFFEEFLKVCLQRSSLFRKLMTLEIDFGPKVSKECVFQKMMIQSWPSSGWAKVKVGFDDMDWAAFQSWPMHGCHLAMSH